MKALAYIAIFGPLTLFMLLVIGLKSKSVKDFFIGIGIATAILTALSIVVGAMVWGAMYLANH